MTVTVRFAPSPTGRLHVGNLRTALMNQLFARRHGGRFILRIDDTDTERSRQEYEDAIRADLAWIGFEIADSFHQSKRFDRYDAAVETLKAKGLLYPCYETAEDLDRQRKIARTLGKPPVYDRSALKLSDAQKAAFEAGGRMPHWRFRLSGKRITWTDLVRGEQSIETTSISDPILVREDGSYLYTLPSVVDDIEMGITHVVRGEDHVTNSGAQIEIFEALGGTAPAFAHTPLLVGKDGEKLSKRLGSLTIGGLREQGAEPLAIASLLAKIGTSDPVEVRRDWDTLAQEFDFSKIGRAPARFDEDELFRLNATLLHETPYAQKADVLKAMGISEALWALARANISRLSEVESWKAVIEGPIAPVIEDNTVPQAAAHALADNPNAQWADLVAAGKATGAKGKALFMPLRLALTGLAHGPEMDQMFALIGPEKALKRLRGEAA